MVKKGVLKKIINIILSILGICSLGILLVFPFLHNSLEHTIAQWLFYCAIPIFCFCSFSKKTKNDVYNLFLSILVLFILISCFVINYYNTAYNWFWFTFILFSLSIPYGCVSIKLFVEKNRKLTKEQNKNFINSSIKYTLFYWLVDLFYMSFFLENLACKFIFGGLLMIIIFYNLGISFLSNKKTNKFLLIHDLVLGLLLTVYLIYIIPNQCIKDIVIPLVSSVYGGILTLVGVAWTIKQNDSDRKNEKRLSVKPLIYPLSCRSEYDYKNAVNLEFIKDDKSETQNIIGVIQNSDNGILIIDNAIVNGKEYKLFNKAVIAKNKAANVYVYTDDTEIETMYIIGRDVLANTIRYKLILNKEKHDIDSIVEEE